MVARARRGSAELLGLAAARVRDEEVAVVGHQEVLDLALGCLVHVLLVEGHDRLSDGLADGVDLIERNILIERRSRKAFDGRREGFLMTVAREAH